MLHHTMPKAWFGCATRISLGTNPSLRSLTGPARHNRRLGLLGLASILALPAKSLGRDASIGNDIQDSDTDNLWPAALAFRG